jgi:hypothetical protein
MASILNNSSFLFNPAGSIIAYEEDKVFSVLPNDGTVDGAVGGNSGGGTRVNQQGYIESVPANFMINSGTTWTPFNVTVTTGVIDPVGGTGAYNIGSIASGNITDYGNKGTNAMSLPAGTVITFSIYMKGSGTIATYLERAIAGTYWFDVKTHTLSSEWQVFTHSYTVPTDASGVGVYVGNATGTTATSVDIAFPSLNYGSTARPYQPTTDRLGYPPIDYKNGKGKLLQEPQRTNLWLQSQNFSNAGATYGLFRLTLTQNAGISPDGTSNAVRWVDTATTGNHQLEPSFTAVSGQTYTVSVFVKAAERTQFHIFAFADNGVFNSTDAFYDVAAGTVISGTGASIEKYPNGWYRCIRTMTAGASGTGYWGVGPAINGAASYAGDTNSGILVWGGQNEASGFPTSLIPTTTATVTRAATDVVFYSPGPTKAFATKPGVILYDFDFYNFADGGGFETFLYNGGTTGGDYFYFAKLGTTPQIYWDGNNNGGYFYAGSFTPKQGKNKVAWYFTNTNSYWYVNGSLLYTGTYFDTTYFPYMQTYAVAGNNFAINTFASIPDTSISQAQIQAWTNFNSGSGGTISYSGPYTVHTFTGSATFTPSFNGQVEVLVVAGGGGGGSGADSYWEAGGGGGAGGLLYASSYGVSAGTGITVTIGAGGAGGLNHTFTSPSNRSGNGSNSVFGSLSAIGGGGGGGAYYAATDGGSGGGEDAYYGTNGNGIVGQGNNGGIGNGIASTLGAGGGGGGAGAIGSNGVSSGNYTGGAGGIGLPYSISGFSTYYAGGGGGKTAVAGSGAGGAGGLGGGGNGGVAGGSAVGSSGVNYTGGGGGGGLSTTIATGAGGNGVVIVRYLT